MSTSQELCGRTGMCPTTPPGRNPPSCCWELIVGPLLKLRYCHPKNYREKVVLSLSTARQMAADSIRTAQARYKKTYDRSSRETDYKLGDWVLVKIPQEETGRMRKLSRPWHGPYRVVDRRDPDLTVVKVYSPQDGQIQIHRNRVAPCPPELPSGFFWYGTRRARSGRPPKWVKQLLQGDLFTDPEGAELPEEPSATEPGRTP